MYRKKTNAVVVVGDVPAQELNKEFPHTLDLRQYWNKKCTGINGYRV